MGARIHISRDVYEPYRVTSAGMIERWEREERGEMEKKE